MFGRSVLWAKSHYICDSLCKLPGLWLDEIKLTAGVSNVSPTQFFDDVVYTILKSFYIESRYANLYSMKMKSVLICRDQEVALSRNY